MKRHELLVVGAGPAGLSAAIEGAKAGMDVMVFDENARPGGQLFKQIHKFFGSKEHHAKERGFRIGEDLLRQAEAAGVKVLLNATVMGIYDEKELTVKVGDEVRHYKGDAVILATGAAENMVPFKGWDTPGVIGAGAAQAFMNLQGVQPGSKVLMVGSGNVGLVVSFQLLQAGCQVAAVIDAAPRVGGYGVHAAKVARTGVPFYMQHTTSFLCHGGQQRHRALRLPQKPLYHQSLTASCLCRGIIKYFPILQNAKIVRTWAGQYDVTKDMVPTIDRVSEVPGLTVAFGFCGHGFGISPRRGHRHQRASAGRRLPHH